MRKTQLMAAVFAVTIAAGCGGTRADTTVPADSDRVRIASFDFAESRLIAELYAQVLETAGFEVERLGSVGPREVVAPALEQGHIDLVPEYVGTAATHFGAASIDTVGLGAALATRGLVSLEAAPAEDVNVFVVTEMTARAHDLVAISDLADVAANFRIGGPVECPDRPLCMAGLQSKYGLSFAEFVPHRSLAITAEALLRDEVDVGVMFSTASEVTAGPFAVLTDDRDMQPDESIVPVVRRAVLERAEARLVIALDSMSLLLTTAALQDMNSRVDDGVSIRDVAAAWLRSVDLSTG